MKNAPLIKIVAVATAMMISSLAPANAVRYHFETPKTACLAVYNYGHEASLATTDIELHIRFPRVNKDTPAKFKADIKEAKVALGELADNISQCKDAKVRNLAMAKASDGKVFIARYTTDNEWHTKMNLALQQYTRCAADYFGTEQGAKCQTRQEELIKYKVQ